MTPERTWFQRFHPATDKQPLYLKNYTHLLFRAQFSILFIRRVKLSRIQNHFNLQISATCFENK